MDDETSEIIPDSPPLDLLTVETILNRRWPETRIEPTLDRITALLDLLGNPQTAAPVIQIAGTNGKTSVSRMIDALLSGLGLRTGRFTSPHLQLVTERISIDGEPISAEQYVRTYADIAPYIDIVDARSEQDGGVPLSKFEILTAMAYAAFADAPVDVMVIETGLGGTWDSTNVVDSTVAVITPIGMDHQDYLGDTMASVAGNKAGIINAGATAVIGPQTAEAMEVLLARAVDQDIAVARYDSEFTVLRRDLAVGGQRLELQGLSAVYSDIFLPLTGEHQAQNASLALAAVEAFLGAGRSRELDADSIRDAFATVSSPGRLERVRTSPTILIDAAHNPHGATALAAALRSEYHFGRLVGVLAVMADKDAEGIMAALAGSFDEVVVTVNSSPRSMPAEELADIARDIFGDANVQVADRMDDAIALAVELAETGGPGEGDPHGAGVLITGSVVSAGDGRTLAGLTPS
ncbi:bifunctional folylpolyglutamate synthase/dihydrofolate synthase [Nakamurella lactea]|uniref:bifunctional folylpolyglutamate synthase/dihydrofolate synthase n=1 Tax=Nakamurella lactea TaxID=459515 RepID=UPI000563D14A